MSDQFSLTGKTALVTGASSGIGRQQSIALAAAGASVVLVGRREDALIDTVNLISNNAANNDTGNNASASDTHVLSWDLLDRDSIDDLAAAATALAGGIDILCNTAGINHRQPADDITYESWDSTINLNLAVPFFLARALTPHMKKQQWGKILNVASLQSRQAFPNGLAYGASKGGIAQVTRAMAQAWSGDGITCNAIAPGFFPTELTAPVFANPDQSDALAERTAMGRNGELPDLDGVTVFLSSPASDYITGQVLYVDGGFTAL